MLTELYLFSGNIDQLLQSFSRENENAANILRSIVYSGLSGKVFSLAQQQPTFFRSAPILYPKKLVSIVDYDEDDNARRVKQAAFLKTLEDIALEAPWKFGYSDIMYKETKFSGLEAQYSAIKTVFWFDDLTDIEKTALLTYDVFKYACRKDGHTYLLQHQIPNHFKFYPSADDVTVPGVTEQYSAIEFLIDHEIVVRQVKDSQERFHLMRYWKAEESICESLEHVINVGDLVLKVDLEDERFSRIQGDTAQMAAARCILQKPITLVSGRGGTGKLIITLSSTFLYMIILPFIFR